MGGKLVDEYRSRLLKWNRNLDVVSQEYATFRRKHKVDQQLMPVVSFRGTPLVPSLAPQPVSPGIDGLQAS